MEVQSGIKPLTIFQPLKVFQVPNLHWCRVQAMYRYFQQWGMEPSLPGELRGGRQSKIIWIHLNHAAPLGVTLSKWGFLYKESELSEEN